MYTLYDYRRKTDEMICVLKDCLNPSQRYVFECLIKEFEDTVQCFTPIKEKECNEWNRMTEEIKQLKHENDIIRAENAIYKATLDQINVKLDSLCG